ARINVVPQRRDEIDRVGSGELSVGVVARAVHKRQQPVRVDVEPIKSLPVERHIEWQRDWARAGVVDAVKRADAYAGLRYVNEASRRSARIGIRQNAIRGQRRGTARSRRGTV